MKKDRRGLPRVVRWTPPTSHNYTEEISGLLLCPHIKQYEIDIWKILVWLKAININAATPYFMNVLELYVYGV